MATNKLYLAVGEEAVRGTGEVTTVGFVPTLAPFISTHEFDERARLEFRGEDIQKGDTEMIRFAQRWNGSIEMPMFTEAGTTAGIIGTLFKHFFGSSSSAQNASTGQYYHMMYQVPDPFSAANLDNDALTLSVNINEGAVMKNWPYLGGRVNSLTFTQEAGQHLVVALGVFGQKRDTTTAELGSETFAAENLRCDYNNLTMYTGTISRVGTPPDFTDFTFGSATQLCPDSVTVSVENGFEDILRLCGQDFPDKTRVGKSKVTIEFSIDWDDPASGFSSVDDFNLWIASASATNFFLHFDTGTQAGTGDNHSLYIDIPNAQRMGGDIEYDLATDPMVTLRYEGLVDSTTLYNIGLMLKNTAAAV